jgi:hypothetical protein
LVEPPAIPEQMATDNRRQQQNEQRKQLSRIKILKAGNLMMLTSNQRETHLCTANFEQLDSSKAVNLLNGNECGQKVHEIQCQSSIDSTA